MFFCDVRQEEVALLGEVSLRPSVLTVEEATTNLTNSVYSASYSPRAHDNHIASPRQICRRSHVCSDVPAA